MRRLMDWFRGNRGSTTAPSAVTPPEVRERVLRRLEEQKAILASLDAEVDARRPWSADERRKAQR